MTFAWPAALALLIVPPLVVAVYLWQRRRRRRFAVAYTGLAMLREALPAQSRWRRHVPFALLLLAMAALAVAAGRPQASVATPINRTSIILTLDVSGSMCSTDVSPNRLAAAEDVARQFVNNQPADTRIGLVVFSGIAELLVPPTSDRAALTTAIDGLSTGRGTAIGTALLRAIDAIAEVDPNVTRTGVDVPGGTTAGGTSGPKAYQPDIVVLLTDGGTTQGIDPITAAKQAAARGVRIYTIGFGTDHPAPLVCARNQVGNNAFGGGGFRGFGGGGGRGSFLDLNNDALQQIADITGASYHHASDAKELLDVFKSLPAEVTIRKQHTEISFAFVALGAVFATAAVGLSLAWNNSW